MIRCEVEVPIVLPTEKCVRVPLPDNYTFVIDDGAENNTFADITEGSPAKLRIRYGFEVGTEVGCDPDRTHRLVMPSKFTLVPFYVAPAPAENKQSYSWLWQIGTSKCWGVRYNIYTEKRT